MQDDEGGVVVSCDNAEDELHHRENEGQTPKNSLCGALSLPSGGGHWPDRVPHTSPLMTEHLRIEPVDFQS